ncbi:MAG: DNA polymerase III subunit beta [Prevotellaceae bacterium]|jgi:DNA polymerase-3 subunit beta|nr:DNA polymerase III subunit beta [Prevotellaceae bacterium]GHT33044.1 DNA polymerase III subunit beta [Bacteroidia bacterium]
MKFIVSSTGLLSHLQSVSRVINSKNTLAILDNFLFDIDGNKLTITASDIETTLITSLDIENEGGNGNVAIASKLLLDSLSGFSAEQPLTFDINDDTLTVKVTSTFGEYNFVGVSGDEYPQLPEAAADAQSLTVPVSTLLNGVNRTLFATANDELRPVMNGILFDFKTDGLTFVASDAHKLVRYKIADIKAETDSSFILAKKPANALKTILPKEAGDVSIQFDTKNAVFTLSNYKMVCRQVEGRFPNYNAVIPQNNPHKAIVDRVLLISSLKRVANFANQASNLIKLQIKNNAIVISAQDIDFSISAEERVTCQYDSEPINIGFKSTFLIDILANIDSPEVIVELADATRAGLFLPFENEENEDLLMLLMPIMLND